MQQDHTQRDKPPAYSQTMSLQLSNSTESSHFPSLYTIDPPRHNRILPPLPFPREDTKLLSQENHVRLITNSLAAYYQTGHPRTSTRSTNSPIESSNATKMESSEFHAPKTGSVLSIDDADVRMAAEALGDLRAGSPPQQNRAIPKLPISNNEKKNQQQEPLLSLLTTSHPLIGNAIGGSLSAYSASKRYSPRFKSSAEYMERRFIPVVNTVGSVGRITGVEGGVRWILGGRNSDQTLSQSGECAEISNKRRKLDEDSEMEGNFTSNIDSSRKRQQSYSSTADSLPSYDELKIQGKDINQTTVASKTGEESSSSGVSWQSRLALSTSGLSIAMSEESLRSLKYCLNWLRWANEHIGKVIMALKTAIEQYDCKNSIEDCERNKDPIEKHSRRLVQSQAERHALGRKITELKKDVLKTLKEVVDIVSKYAGGALPENARILVRRHLTSLPRRFCLASSRPIEGTKKSDNADVKFIEGGRRVLVLAKEGLDMMAQVSGVLDSTIMSAEDWCERLGRNSRETRHNEISDVEVIEKPLHQLSHLNLSELPDYNTGI